MEWGSFTRSVRKSRTKKWWNCWTLFPSGSGGNPIAVWPPVRSGDANRSRRAPYRALPLDSVMDRAEYREDGVWRGVPWQSSEDPGRDRESRLVRPEQAFRPRCVLGSPAIWSRASQFPQLEGLPATAESTGTWFTSALNHFV